MSEADPQAVHLAAGSHLLADLSGIEASRLGDCDELEALLRSAAAAAGARVLHSHFHGFGAGMGVTGVVLLAESHISIHTWPENGFAAVDIFMCGASQPRKALDVIQAALAPHSCVLHTVRRAAAPE
ncbi:adenosylmethionine decarboxylase [Pseudoduganella aquatica]|uniref:S-adenosylmethionine decarboxylase proenzyme n=1 Tax=Pseudoduganella aquatica TaxID=2660641 RepID=A0A7X4H6X5_9BURK|nr:adenosylmethionine decarboxylase [Pseudoduganella aquatica]MYN05838.1 adenosylmethionine decarboxylase [Pseudoduganella aquatica]